MQSIALERGGWCLSPEYFDSDTKLWFQCGDCENIWNARPHDVKHKNSWCPECYRKFRAGKYQLLTIEQMQNIALEKGGWCLSLEYFTEVDKLWWQCGEEGHVWDAVPRNIIHNDAWCPHCRKGKTGYNIKIPIEEIKTIIEKKGGKLLFKTYDSLKSEIEIECKLGHKWTATAGSIKSAKSWCPICSGSISERICRNFFEEIFKEKLPKKRPSWLLSEKGYRMELDGYCEKLGLAFEYQGGQHYKDHFFKYKPRKIMFKDIQKQDELKKILCKKNNVVLIEVPYKITADNMQSFIIEQCEKNSIYLPKPIKKINYDAFDVYAKEYLKFSQEYAIKKGGRCLSKTCLDRDSKLKFICAKGHYFSTTPHSLKSMKTWCPECSKVLMRRPRKVNRNYKKFPHKHVL